MKIWQLKFWETESGQSPVEKWLEKLAKDQLKTVLKEMQMLKFSGNMLRLPHSKALGQVFLS